MEWHMGYIAVKWLFWSTVIAYVAFCELRLSATAVTVSSAAKTVPCQPRSIYEKSLPSKPVISKDSWAPVDSDCIVNTGHEYSWLIDDEIECS